MYLAEKIICHWGFFAEALSPVQMRNLGLQDCIWLPGNLMTMKFRVGYMGVEVILYEIHLQVSWSVDSTQLKMPHADSSNNEVFFTKQSE